MIFGVVRILWGKLIYKRKKMITVLFYKIFSSSEQYQHTVYTVRSRGSPFIPLFMVHYNYIKSKLPFVPNVKILK
jgi:hypothetical protein